MKADVPV